MGLGTQALLAPRARLSRGITYVGHACLLALARLWKNVEDRAGPLTSAMQGRALGEGTATALACRTVVLGWAMPIALVIQEKSSGGKACPNIICNI